jgi:hypothetical protein
MPRPITISPELAMARELIQKAAARARRCTDITRDAYGADLYLFARAEEGDTTVVTIHGPADFISRLVDRAVPGFEFDPHTFPLGPGLGLSTRTYRSVPAKKRKGARE